MLYARIVLKLHDLLLPLPSRANGSDYDVLGCATPDDSPPDPPGQPGAIPINVDGDGCEATFNSTTNTCNNAVASVSYCVHVDDNGWIGKVRFFGLSF